MIMQYYCVFFFFQAEDGIRDLTVTGVQTCALPISLALLQVRLAVRPPRLQPTVAPRLDVLVQLLHGRGVEQHLPRWHPLVGAPGQHRVFEGVPRSEEHTSELQSQSNLVCRLLLEKKK